METNNDRPSLIFVEGAPTPLPVEVSSTVLEAPITTLPHTGFEPGTVGLGAALIVAGVLTLRKSRRFA